MIYELVDSMEEMASIYFYYTEKRMVKRKEGESGGSTMESLTLISKNLKKVKGLQGIVREVNSWKDRLDEKYSAGEKMDDAEKVELEKDVWRWMEALRHRAAEVESEAKTIDLLEERIENMEKSIKPILPSIREYVSEVQSATIAFIESSPTVRSLEPAVRGLMSKMEVGELAFTGYFDQHLLKDFKAMNLKKVRVRSISPELTSSKQDKINLDALQRLAKMGAYIRFHPMLHARMVVSPTEVIVGSGDIKSDCLGGRRYDAGIWSNNPVLVQSSKAFLEKIWDESKPL